MRDTMIVGLRIMRRVALSVAVSSGLAAVVIVVVASGIVPEPVALAAPERQMEHLGRGLVSIRRPDGAVFVGWRLLGTDPERIAFNVYRASGNRAPLKLNERPLDGPTHLLDSDATAEETHTYTVRPVLGGEEGETSAPAVVAPGAPSYLSVPLQTPEGYRPNDASVGDLDGDGEYEIVVHRVGRGRDNSQRGTTTEPILEAYRLDGAFLWRINLGRNIRNLGRNIREGAHCADILGDSREGVIWRTRDGKELRIATTTEPTEHRLATLMHDPVYRLSVAWRNVSYNQPAYPGYFLGHGMKKAPRAAIRTVRAKDE